MQRNANLNRLIEYVVRIIAHLSYDKKQTLKLYKIQLTRVKYSQQKNTYLRIFIFKEEEQKVSPYRYIIVI